MQQVSLLVSLFSLLWAIWRLPKESPFLKSRRKVCFYTRIGRQEQWMYLRSSLTVAFCFPRSGACVYCLPRSPFEVTASSVLVGNLLPYVDCTWSGQSGMLKGPLGGLFIILLYIDKHI